MNWKCNLPHKWNATINNIAKNKSDLTGCPYCAGKKPIVGVTDLMTTHPQLILRAYEWDLSSVSVGSDQVKIRQCKYDQSKPIKVYNITKILTPESGGPYRARKIPIVGLTI